MLEDGVDRGPLGFARSIGLGDDSLGKGELGIAEWIAGSLDAESGEDVAFVPVEIVIAVAVEIDHCEVIALGDSQDLCVDRLGCPSNVDVDQTGPAHDVAVGDGDPGGIDDEARTGATSFELAKVGCDKGAGRDDLNGGEGQLLDGGDQALGNSGRGHLGGGNHARDLGGGGAGYRRGRSTGGH